MRRAVGDAGRGDFDGVRRGIERWREGRRGGEAMPAELWSAAVALARVHGPGVAARRLGVDYGRLKGRVGACSGGIRSGHQQGGFVDAGPAGTLFARAFGVEGDRNPSGALEVELALPTGERLTIRLPASHDVDLVELLRAVRSQR